MPRGGRRKGRPGRAYTNRTDMMGNYDMEAGSPAAGGIEPPAEVAPQMGLSPDDIPSLSTPTQRPGEPITAGLGLGPGAGREALTGFDPRMQETQRLAERWGPMMDILSNDPETPDSVRMLARYIKGFS